jgi:ABC-type amino acid transport substrate-binding protein
MGGKWFLGCFTAALVVLSGPGKAATVDHIRQDNAIRIAYRRDAPPFSYQDAAAKPAGFIVDLCRAVAKRLAQQLNLPSLKIDYVPVTASDRFDAASVLERGKMLNAIREHGIRIVDRDGSTLRTLCKSRAAR